MRLSVRLSVYVGLTIFKVNKLLTLIAGFAPSMFYILLVIIIISFTGSYNGLSKPVYHSLLNGSSSGSCTDYCQITSSTSLALQITTPLTPPTPSSLQSFQRYIDGEMTGSDFDEVSFSIIDRREYMYIAYCFMCKDLVA